MSLSQNIFTPRKLYFSKAYLSLNRNAIIVYGAFLCKRQFVKSGHNGQHKWLFVNNGELVFVYSEAQNKYNISAKQFTRAIDQLIQVGFLDINKPGKSLGKIPTVYTLSDRWMKYGELDFIEKRRNRRKIQEGFSSPQKMAK